MWSFGEDFIFLGYPSKDGAGINVIQPNMEIAVASGSKMKDVCWEFIKYLISYDCQKNLSWCFPVNRQAMDEQKEAARPSSYTYEGSAAAAAGETEDYYSRDLTDEQLNQIVEVIDSAHIVQRDYEEIVNIINEEAASYYSGQKTAQAAADIIQSRVSIYISENS